MDQKQLGVRSRAASSATAEPLPASSSFPPSFNQSGRASRAANTLADRYLTFLHLAPGVQALLGDTAELEHVQDEHGGAPAARSASDFSYSAEGYAGVGYRIIGDAGGALSLFSCLSYTLNDGARWVGSVYRPVLLIRRAPCDDGCDVGGCVGVRERARRLQRGGGGDVA